MRASEETLDDGGQSCLCTSCSYKSESERPSLRRIIADGSRIDKLYYGKYIPLRERKLLDKLVRTRAVYDDIRNQLLSESDVSINEKANLKPRKHIQARPKDMTATEKSSMILELVDLVDKGKVAGGKNLSECCSCCSCGSKLTHTHEHTSRMRRHRHMHGHPQGGAYTMSRSSLIRKKLGEVRRSVRFKAKSIRSAPSIRSKVSGMIKRHSQEIIKRLRPEGTKAMLEEQTVIETYEQNAGGPRRKKMMQRTYQKMKKSKTRLMESMGEGARKIRDSKTRIKEYIDAEGKKSLEKINQAKHKVKENVKTIVSKSIRRKLPPAEELNYEELDFQIKSKNRLMESMGEGARKIRESRTRIKEYIDAEGKKSLEKINLAKHKVKENVKTIVSKSIRRKQPTAEELNDEELDFQIKKDSITKFKERLHRRKLRDYYACEHECIPGECVPEDCFKIIKLRRIRREKKEKLSRDNIGVEKNIGFTTSASSVAVQAHQKGTVVTTETDHNKKKVIKRRRPSAEQRISIDVGIKKTGIEPRVTVTKSRKVKDKLNVRCACEEAHSKEPTKETMSIKSTTSLPPVSEPNQQESMKPKKGQQESSSVSFGIDIRQGDTMGEKAPQKKAAVAGQMYMKKHGQGQNAKLSSDRIKEAKTGSHALKRCFCTLKLKAKGHRSKPIKSTSKNMTTATQSITSTRKLDQIDKNVHDHAQTKRLKHHERRPKATGVSVKPRHKSVSSLTSKSLSTGSIIHHGPKKIDKNKKRSSSSSRKLEQLKENTSQRQVVRIGSTFSFNIEFYKDKPKDETLELTQEKVIEDRVKKNNRGTGKKKRLRHRHSQISSSTGKSKYTFTKHSLRRCFCTLKLAHADKNKMQTTTRSQGSVTSYYTPDVTINVNKAIATDKKYKLSPYECEPGVCVPGECDPYVCQKRMNTKQMKYHTKHSNTDNRKTKSTSSLTSRSIPNRAKKIQSTTATNGSPSKKHKNKGKTLRRIRTTPSSPERQVVRIASSFSFNIEFYKDNTHKSSPTPIDNYQKDRPSKSSEITAKPKKDRRNQEKVKNRQKSTSMLVKKKNRGSFIAPAMKRCFCTLKLQKTKDDKQKRVISQATTGTKTLDNNVIDYKNVMITKGTKTKPEKLKFGYVLEPYECEPNVCVPGECDPYECLKRIQMRQVKESGTLTEKAKMKSATSVTQKSKFRSKGALAKSKYKPKKLLTNVKNVGGDADFEQTPQRQAVRIGSAFSFNIEFHKDMTPSNTIKEDTKDVIKYKTSKKSKHRGAGAREASSSHQNTQVAAIRQAHKAAGIRPMLKRCFCTLKLQSKNDRKLKTNIKKPKVITVSRVTVTETKITDSKTLNFLPANNSNQGLSWAAALFNINSSSTFSTASVVFQYKEMKSYFHNQKSLNSIPSNPFSDKISNHTSNHCNMLDIQSNLILPTCYTKVNDKCTCSENCIFRRANKEKLLRKRNNILKNKKRYVTRQKSENVSKPHISEQQQDHKGLKCNQISSPRYYAMNVQVPHRNKHTARRPIQHKLKPYECEPGICVPDECDPYECEKLIRKRLMKRVDKIAGTNTRSKSISSYASQSTSNSQTKKLQSMRAPRGKAKKVPASGIKYESVPNRKHKQAVRVGSSFSFNIEFSKDRSSLARTAPREALKPSKSHRPTKPPRKIVRAKGTKGYGVDNRDQDAQSVTLSENKGSGMKPIMQRCFCTLKLQKKGKNQKVKKEKRVQHAFEKGTATPPNTLNDFIASRTMMNTGQNTANQKPYKLLPYECEPLVCIPGKCNPYECLERIKQRNKKLKDSGTGAMRYKTSSSSNTGQRIRAQARHVQSNERKHRKSRESTTTRSSNIVTSYAKPSRQAVRVGSSFSFNVEFFKEKSQTSATPTKVVQRETRPLVEKPPKQKEPPKQKQPKKKVRVVGLQNDKTYKHGTSQMGSELNQVKSTMTNSFIKRCFCTAKLHGKGKGHKNEKNTKVPRQEKIKPKITQAISVDSKASQAKETKSFLKRCFCVLKLKKDQKIPKQKNANAHPKTAREPVTVDKKVVTAPYKNRLRDLKPYECEPGICVPGECNPYECAKFIKARNVKLDTREAFTDRARTRSTSSSFKSSKTSKARRTQSNLRSPSTISRQQLTKTVKETPSNVEPRPLSSNRQVVRIGSNFSFNIEFYKDRSPNTDEVQAAAKAVRRKRSPEPKIKTVKTGKEYKTKHKGSSDGISVTTHNQKSQANKAKLKNRATGIAPALKRCFCTLKLQKRNIATANYTTQKIGTGAVKEIPTLQNRGVMTTGRNRKLLPYECEPNVCIPYECDPFECEKLIKKRNLRETTKAVMTTKQEKEKKPIGYKLLPYECEPNFCIPGQCDPYECEKRIKLRNIKHRTSGTSPKRYRGKSISSDIRSISGSKARKVQSPKIRDRRRTKSVSSKPFRSIKSLDSSRQSVKIGSGFSFDIEFSKNKSLNRPENQVKPIKQRVKHTKSMSSSAKQRLARTKNNKMQHRKYMRDTDSQIVAQKMRDTGVNPFLKRCFCTLKLQKSGEMASKHAIGRAARDRNVYLARLLPYECEPGICIPGKCDPYECEKRIKRRQMRTQLSGTEKSSQDSSTTVGHTKFKAAKNQALRDAQAQKRRKATYVKRDYGEPRRSTMSSKSSSRQAIRLGSSFKFDVEFYKDNSRNIEERPRSHSRPMKKMETIKTKPLKMHKRSRSVTSSDIKQQHNKMQTKGSKTESKSTGFGPLLKRCFCTLALHKQKSPPTSKTKATYRNDDLSDLYQYSKNVGVGTGKKFHKLKPYECEPNVCVPGQCDPYECYERIKRRIKNTGTETPSPKKKYASSITSKQPKIRSANTQAIKQKQRKDRPSMTSTMRERLKTQRAPKYLSTPGETARQAVKIGSNFSFSLEFYKERPNATKIPKAMYKMKGLDEKSKRYRTSKTSPQKTFSNMKTYTGKKVYDEKCQVDCVKNTSKGTTMGAFIKRCFCTLNLHKNPPRSATKEKIVPTVTKLPKVKKVPAPLDKTRPAMVQTKEKYTAEKTLPYKLKPYECEPNICVPGECNPYECLERIKRRNVRRHSRRTGTHMRTSQVSVSSMTSRLVPRNSRRVQSGEKRTRKVSQPQQVPRVVEQPRFAHMFESPNRKGVKFGSNVSINIEFYKDTSKVPTINDYTPHDDYKPKEPKLKRLPRQSTYSESRPKGIQKGIGGKSYDKRTSESQADSSLMKNKAAGVNNMLKRCFCTLKLQKNAMKAPKVVTVNRCTIEEDYRMRYMHTQKVTNNQRNPSLLPFSTNDNYHDYLINTINSDNKCKEMKTLYPYTPKKFNKNISKTILLRNDEVRKNNLIRNSCSFYQSPGMATEKARLRKSVEKDTKFQTQTLKERGLGSHKKSKGKLFLHKLFTRLFSKRKPEEKQIVDNMVLSKPNNLCYMKPDTVKSSKSDRRPTNVKKNEEPKKTTSLKATTIPNKLRTRQEAYYYQKHKKFSYFQSGDTCQVYPAVKQHLPKTVSPENKLNVRSPYETDKIVQMAIMKPAKGKKANTMVNTTTNTQVKKTRTKSVEASDNPKEKASLLHKCMCFIDKVRSKRDIKNKNATSKTIENEIKTGSNKNKMNNPIAELGSKNYCPCPRNRKKMLSSGDNQAGQQQTVPAKGGKKQKNKKRLEFEEVAGGAKNQKNKTALQSGDAPEITTDKNRYYKNKKVKSRKNKTTEMSTNASNKCNFPTPCPCCLGKKDTRKPQLLTGKPVAQEVTTSTDQKIKPKFTRKDQKIKPKTTSKDQKVKPKTTSKDQKVKPKTTSKDQKVKAETGEGTKYKSGTKKYRGKNKKPYGAKITIRAKGDPTSRSGAYSKEYSKEKQKEAKTRIQFQPCICGSKVCAKESKKTKTFTKKKKIMQSTKPCVCGSDICARESKKKAVVAGEVKKKSKHLVCECQKIYEKTQARLKVKAEAEKIKLKKVNALKKKFKQEDKKRKQTRAKADAKAEKQAQKYNNASDGVLAAESFLDMIKLCATTGSDVARCTSRAVFHPRVTYHNLQGLVKNPSRSFNAMGDALHGSGVFSTCRRVKQRCRAMKAMKQLKDKMESNPITHFLWHAADKDPKKRLAYKKKKKMKRRREPIDFECSLFMASLRRKPCLAVYYTCPWFYPHCLSMLTLWKQFTDVMLFIIAVTVWSPCIVGMEICRAFVCCFFCTG